MPSSQKRGIRLRLENCQIFHNVEKCGTDVVQVWYKCGTRHRCIAILVLVKVASCRDASQ